MAKEIRIDGMDQLHRFFRTAPDAVLAGAEAGLVIEGNAAMGDAKSQTPVDTGTLRASGTVLEPERTPTGVSIELGFGGAAKEYALIVHSNPTLHHASGNSHFLERPVLARAVTLPRVLAAEIGRALARLRVR